MKPSFKTTALIAAIGMSIAVGYSIAVRFMYGILDIDLYAHPVRMRGLWRLHDCMWWASTLIFFWGMFRYPDQLPKPCKWAKVVCYAVLASVAVLFVSRSFLIVSYSDPLWLKGIKYALHLMAQCCYLGAMWWCYAKSDNGKTQVVVRYITVAAVILCSMALLFEVCAGIAWLNGYVYMFSAPYASMYCCYNLLYAGVVACILISMFVDNPAAQIAPTTKVQKKAKRLYVVGWILVTVFAICAVLVATMVKRSSGPDWLMVVATILFFATPLVAGIYLIIASKTLQDTCHIIETQTGKTRAEEEPEVK